jgi:hypothetical protein
MPSLGHLALGRQAVDDAGQDLGQLARSSVAVHADLRGQIAQRVLTQDLTELVGGDRLVGAGADPGVHHIAEASLLELVHEATQASLAIVIAQHAGDGLQDLGVLGQRADQASQASAAIGGQVVVAGHGTEYGIKQTHGILLLCAGPQSAPASGLGVASRAIVHRQPGQREAGEGHRQDRANV